MTISVSSLGQTQTFDQPDVSFQASDDGLQIVDGDGNEIALFNNWDSVSTDAFDVAVTATPPVAGAPEATTANPAPPEPTPHAPVEPPAPPAPVETSVPADASTAPVADASTTDTSASDVVIPAQPGGVTIGSPASEPA